MKNKKNLEKYNKRLLHEFNIIKEMHYAGYFLIVSDYIKWAKNTGGNVTLQLELHVTGEAKPIVLKQPIKPSRRSGWDAVTLDGDAFKAIGKIVAWQVRLLDGDIELAKRRSFLWTERKPAGDAEKPAAD